MDWECCAAEDLPAPIGQRMVIGTLACPPDIYRIFAIWLITWSAATSRKSENISSITGRRPVSAMPTPIPTKPCSEIGVSFTRRSPYFSKSPTVHLKFPPINPISSPSITTFSSRAISSSSASQTACAYVSSFMFPFLSVVFFLYSVPDVYSVPCWNTSVNASEASG